MDCYMMEAREHQGMTNLEGKTIESEYNGPDTVGQTQQECLRARDRKDRNQPWIFLASWWQQATHVLRLEQDK